MYQYYYANKKNPAIETKYSVYDRFDIKKVRVTMWEEHCLECSSPLCYETCLNYTQRQDGRCRLFDDSIAQYKNDNALLGNCARVKFKKWGNMMTVIYPKMVTIPEYEKIDLWADKISRKLLKVVNGKFSPSNKWKYIRAKEFLRRRKLRQGVDETSDAFILHCYNHSEISFILFMEVFDENHTSLFKYGFNVEVGENLVILPKEKYNDSCDKSGNVVKLYPENNFDADITFFWCDFVKGVYKKTEHPANKVKCVVWDLDNTLWDGVLIENDNEVLKLKSGIINLIKKLDERGIVQSISSKNEYEQAWNMLKKIGISDYFIYPQINWNPKSDSLVTISKSLNIGIDTFALIDDSAFERGQVSTELPQVRVYADFDIPTLLDRPEFSVIVTDDSKKRRLMYQAEEKRNSIKSASKTNIDDFIKQCEIKLNVFLPKTKEQLLRCYELVLRTNQLNMSGVKYSESEFQAVLAKEHYKTFAVSCKDKFGEYGIVAFIQYYIEDECIKFSEFAMSCRVAGKFVESALFKYLLNMEHVNKGYFSLRITEKNKLLRTTLESIGFKTIRSDKKSISYEFDGNLHNSDLVIVEE